MQKQIKKGHYGSERGGCIRPGITSKRWQATIKLRIGRIPEERINDQSYLRTWPGLIKFELQWKKNARKWQLYQLKLLRQFERFPEIIPRLQEASILCRQQEDLLLLHQSQDFTLISHLLSFTLCRTSMKNTKRKPKQLKKRPKMDN